MTELRDFPFRSLACIVSYQDDNVCYSLITRLGKDVTSLFITQAPATAYQYLTIFPTLQIKIPSDEEDIYSLFKSVRIFQIRTRMC